MKSSEEKEREKASKWSGPNSITPQTENKEEGQCGLKRETVDFCSSWVIGLRNPCEYSSP